MQVGIEVRRKRENYVISDGKMFGAELKYHSCAISFLLIDDLLSFSKLPRVASMVNWAACTFNRLINKFLIVVFLVC